MPTFSSGGDDWGSFLEVILGKGENFTDEVIRKVPLGTRDLSIKKEIYDEPLSMNGCSAEMLGDLHLRTLRLMGIMDDLDDTIFKYCSDLEMLHLGGSSVEVFERTPTTIIKHCKSLQKIRVNGVGYLKCGKGMNELIQHVGIMSAFNGHDLEGNLLS